MRYRVLKKQNSSAWCIVCGTKNDSSFKARFYECEKEDGSQVLLTIFSPKDIHQSYPGRMHGGMSAAMLDESVGRAVCIERPGTWGVTFDLAVKYRKPVPLDQDLYCETVTTKITSRGFEGEGKLFTKDGTVCVTAVGKYLILDPTKISSEGISEENWFYVDEDLPEFIDIC
ncbi:MAG: PaaI family thioesterase [Firmicutes bacterium]|nr:PaaI family thioesterase [Bacillota bacterium]